MVSKQKTAGDNLNRTMELSATSASLREQMAKLTSQKHCLVVMRGLDVGNVILLGRDPLVTGRDEACDVTLTDEGISRRHARFRLIADQVIVEDMGSTNGVYVNGEQIQAAVLADGDKILLGRFTILKYSRQDEMELEYQRSIHESASIDGLTGALNRRTLESRIEAEWSFARRHGTSLSAIMLDVDHFKRVNDTFGHSMGDQVLSALGRTILSTIRKEDLFARYGGEEFLLIVRGVEHAGAMGLAQRLRIIIECLDLQSAQGPVAVTISSGVATSPNDPAETPQSLIALADQRLYLAKQTGRNRVVGG